MNQTDNAFQLAEVTYRYPGSGHGVNDVSLTVPRGGVYGLVGANGAGKTTVLRLMTGLLRPTSGRVLCNGSDIDRNRAPLLRSVGSLIETPSLYHHLTGAEHLRIFCEYTATPRSAISRALSLVHLDDAAKRRISEFSLGMKQRLGIATALLHDPSILILDEPTNGLDPMGIADMRALIVDLTNVHAKTVVVSSHLLAEVEKLASRIGVIDAGRLRFEGTMSDLAARTSAGTRLLVRVSSVDRAKAVIQVASIAPDRQTLIVDNVGEAQGAQIIRLLVEAGIEVMEMRRERQSLERDFFALVGRPADA